jgi:Flp pilus assembly protein TadD
VGGIAAVVLLLLVTVIWRVIAGRDTGEPPLDPYQVAERAFEMVRQGQWATGLRMAEEVLATVPDLPRAVYAKAKALEHLGRIGDALVEYRRVIELNPALVGARFDWLHLRLTRGESAAALQREVQDLLVAVDPSTQPELYRETVFLLLRAQISAQDWPAARATLETASKVASGDPRVLTLGAQIPADVAPVSVAVTEAKPVAARKPAAPVADRAPESKPSEAKPAESGPSRPAVKPVPKEELPPKPSAADEAKKLHEKGIAFYRKGYLRDAKRVLAEARDKDSSNDEIWVDLGRVHVELGEDREAMEAFLAAGKLNARNPRVWSNLGSLYMLQGDNARARKAFETFLTLVPVESPEAAEIRKVLDKALQ